MTTYSYELISVSTDGAYANGESLFPKITPDGRFVTFASYASNLVGNDTNGQLDIFLRDLATGATSRISVSTSGEEANGYSYSASISANGRYVAFDSDASNLVVGDHNANKDVFVRDVVSGTTTRISNLTGSEPAITPDGRYVAFDAGRDIVIRDLTTGHDTIATVGFDGAASNGQAARASISADGRYVAFQSNATNLVSGEDPNGVAPDVFLRDLWTNTTTRVPAFSDPGENDTNWAVLSSNSSLTSDGRYLAFVGIRESAADSYFKVDVLLFDTLTGLIELISHPDGAIKSDRDSQLASISGNGRYIGFWSTQLDLVPENDQNGTDLYLYDHLSASMEQISIGVLVDAHYGLSLSEDGTYVVFQAGGHLVLLDRSEIDSTNGLPVVDLSQSSVAAALSERSGLTASTLLDHVEGELAFVDPNSGDRPTASVVSKELAYKDSDGNILSLTLQQASSLKNAFSISPEAGNTNSGTIDWTFSIADRKLDFIGAGERVILTSSIRLDDQHGGVADQNMTVTIRGANDTPLAKADAIEVGPGAAVKATSVYGVLANDRDSDVHDVLRVVSISFGTTTVPISDGTAGIIKGAYGTLVLKSDGSYRYSATTKLDNQNLIDTFRYSVVDGHGGKASASLNVKIQAVRNGGEVLNTAIGHLDEAWGISNCTGFVYTVSYETHKTFGFFDPAREQVSWIDPRGSDGVGPLLNNGQYSDKADVHGFPVPISDLRPIGAAAEQGSTTFVVSPTRKVFARNDVPGDEWQLIGNGSGNNTTTIVPADANSLPQPGDLFRGVVTGGNGKLITHSGVVSAYDPEAQSIWLISNWRSNHQAENAPITHDQFLLNHSGSSRDIAGPFAIYRLNGVSNADSIHGGSEVDYLGGGNGVDTLEGKHGSDRLWGGPGKDHFVYTASTDGRDEIMDFAKGDALDFSHRAFGDGLAASNLNVGALDRAHFVANSRGPITPDQKFWYNGAKDILYYDSDGSGTAKAIAVIHFANGFTPSDADIHLI